MTGHFPGLLLLPKSTARWQRSAQHKPIINSGSRDPGWWDYRWLFTSVPLFLSAFTFICLFLRLNAGLIIFLGHLLLSPLISSRRYCFASYKCSHFLFAFSQWKYSLISVHCLVCLAWAALRSTAARHSPACVMLRARFNRNALVSTGRRAQRISDPRWADGCEEHLCTVPRQPGLSSGTKNGVSNPGRAQTGQSHYYSQSYFIDRCQSDSARCGDCQDDTPGAMRETHGKMLAHCESLDKFYLAILGVSSSVTMQGKMLTDRLQNVHNAA